MDYISKHKTILISISLFVLGIMIGNLKNTDIINIKNENFNLKKDGKYKYINPLLYCTDIENLSNKNTNDIKDKIVKIIDNFKNQGKITDSAVYFRDLNNGPWFGINEKTEFIPGSLLKVPLMLSILKHAENNPEILNKKFYYQDQINLDSKQEFPSGIKIKPNTDYSVNELLSYMIINSDNNAAIILSKTIPENEINTSYEELGLVKPENSKDYYVSVKNYASFFRILYNGTYINKNFSEEALKLLSSSSFKEGLVKKIPSNIEVAHKFGERTNSQIKQLHDCGIIYYPNDPYILCIMTKGYDMRELSDFISEVSKTVFYNIKY